MQKCLSLTISHRLDITRTLCDSYLKATALVASEEQNEPTSRLDYSGPISVHSLTSRLWLILCVYSKFALTTSTPLKFQR